MCHYLICNINCIDSYLLSCVKILLKIYKNKHILRIANIQQYAHCQLKGVQPMEPQQCIYHSLIYLSNLVKSQFKLEQLVIILKVTKTIIQTLQYSLLVFFIHSLTVSCQTLHITHLYSIFDRVFFLMASSTCACDTSSPLTVLKNGAINLVLWPDPHPTSTAASSLVP